MSGLLYHGPDRILLQLLYDLELAAEPADPVGPEWTGYFSQHPDAPDNSLAVFSSEGRQFGRTQTDGEIQQQFGFLIRLRSNGEDGYARGSLIVDELSKVLRETVTIDSRNYLIQCVNFTSGVIPLGPELGGRRKVWTLNGLLPVRLQISGTGS